MYLSLSNYCIVMWVPSIDDFVKVRVWLGAHCHVLSRYLISRLLTVTKVGARDAVSIALALKRSLVDAGAFDVSLSTLEERLFAVRMSRTLSHLCHHCLLHVI
jgi:hypothetical protein